MRLEDIDRANTLQRQREYFIRLLSASVGGRLDDLYIHDDEGGIAVFGSIPADFIRSAIAAGSREALVKIDADLASVGVHVANPFSAEAGDAAGWRRTAEMYVTAWTRELGGSLIAKRHLIDALVLTTRELREKAERADKKVEP